MKTVVGLFDNFAQAQNAYNELEQAGIPRTDISMMASNATGQYDQYATTTTTNTGDAVATDATAGAAIGGGIGLLMGLGLFVIPGFGPIAAAGWLASMLTGAGIGALAGGLIGLLVNAGVPEVEARTYEEGVRRGGTLVAVRAEDNNADSVARILNDNGAVNVDERAAAWQSNTYGTEHVSRTGTGPTLPGEGNIPGVQTGGHALDGTPDTRGITEKVADTLTGDRIDDKTGKRV